tara:strand:- start:2874 stop:2978 length:105 start_codon:yes stop_codon:yes gene_type:complete
MILIVKKIKIKISFIDVLTSVETKKPLVLKVSKE